MRSYLRGLIGQPRGGCTFVGVDQLINDWTFRPSRPDPVTFIERRSRRRHLTAPPPSRMIAPVPPRPRWALYFIYAPDGRLQPSHLFTMRQLRSADTGLAVVFASASPDDLPRELLDGADALYWKGLSGFDFSAYALGLGALAEGSPGSDVFVMNDSVYGPFAPLATLWEGMKWDLTGFTASGNIQNHIQSYAFMLRAWERGKLDGLSGILRRTDAYPDHRDVVFCQETVFAQQAARTMSVGAAWYADYEKCSDVTLWAGLALVEAGLPFMKKSIFTKFAHLVDQPRARAVLRATGYPAPD